MTVT
jgi:hypothetical protein